MPGGRSAKASHGEERLINQGRKGGCRENLGWKVNGQLQTSVNPGYDALPVQGGHVDPVYTAQVSPI